MLIFFEQDNGFSLLILRLPNDSQFWSLHCAVFPGRARPVLKT